MATKELERLPRLLVTLDEAARTLGLSRKTLLRRVADSTVRAVRIGRRLQVPISEIERLVAGA